MTTTTNRPSPALRLLGVALALVALLVMLQPASGEAATTKAKFGADLSQPGIAAVAAPVPCPLAGACTRVQGYYAGPPHAGNVPFAPFNGTITKLRLLAESPGKLKLQLVRRGQMSDSKVTRNGPTIRYQGTGSVETFKVDLPVRKNEWLGFKAKQANTLTCDPVNAGEGYVYQPALAPGGPFAAAYSTEQCTALIGATAVKG